MENLGCYRSNCHIYSLYWASQSEVPIIECTLEVNILEIPTPSLDIPIDNSINVNRTTAEVCDIPYLLEETVFTYSGEGILEKVKITSIPENGSLVIGERIITLGEELTVLDDFSEGLYYIPNELNSSSYTDTVMFQIKTNVGSYNEIGVLTINVSACNTVEVYTACETYSLYFSPTPY